ncbi:hypothetical protein [Rhizobium leguminosarum]|uniref:hypothetical protein n=1 Tax=Rhizobium leguminosarum TaxID=384 RepID=UPI001C90BD5D|nr:hypothetical protein [Rhizobium leguminosarum]MBY2998424.1 hypothetical protein [Rhizobium leguminosarum]
MTFNEANTVEAHLCDRLTGTPSARPAQLSVGLARTSSRIAGLGWHHLTATERNFFGFRCRSVVGREGQLL